MKEYKMRGNSTDGITLIALVITIIVLLILAAVSIATLTGQNGILTRGTDAKKITVEEGIYEEVKVAYNGVQTKGYPEGWTLEQKAEELERDLQKEDPNASVEVSGTDLIVKYKEYTFIIDENGKLIDTGKETEGAEIYAKLYTYEDGRGSLLELSSDPNHISTEEGVNLETVTNYGNIGATEYNYDYLETKTEYNGSDIAYYTEKNSIMPPWLTLRSMYSGPDGCVTMRSEYYYDEKNIVQVNIVDAIKPKSTACWFAKLR